MNTPSESTRAWAEELLAIEGARPSVPEAETHAVVRVLERLRISLTRFVGADGFRSLQRRAVTLARRDFLSLQTVTITAEGRLEGFEGFPADAKKDFEAAIAIIAHLLSLLVAFVGQYLTLRLVREAFEDASDRSILESEDFQ